MGKTKKITDKQKQRAELDAVLDFNESQLVAMQRKGWHDLNDDQINLLENLLATAIETMRLCPPAYVAVASNNLVVRSRAVKAAEAAVCSRHTPGYRSDDSSDDPVNILADNDVKP